MTFNSDKMKKKLKSIIKNLLNTSNINDITNKSIVLLITQNTLKQSFIILFIFISIRNKMSFLRERKNEDFLFFVSPNLFK